MVIGKHRLAGGGVVVLNNGTFTKSGGTIYGDDDGTHTVGNTENTAVDVPVTSGYGHEVYVDMWAQHKSCSTQE
jgi:hypothetical protein